MRSHFLPLLAAIVVAACHRSPEPAVRGVPKVSTFEVSGIVRKVDAGRRKLVIAHETIPGFMEAMVMEFDVANGETLATVAPGDVLAFRLSVAEERSWIDQLRKTGRAAVSPVSVTPFGSLSAGAPLPDGALVDQRGKAFQLADFKGRALAITFIFTRCPLPDFCPLMNRNLAAAQRELAADGSRTNWHLLSISIDPEYDTPARLSEYARTWLGEGGQWTFATGDPAEIQKLGEAFGLTVARNGAQIDHTLRTVVVDAAGRVQRVFVGNEWGTGELIAEMERAMAAKP